MLTVTLTSKTLERGAVQVQRLVGREALSSLFEYEVDVVSAHPRGADPIEAHLRDLLDQPVRIGFVDGLRSHDVCGVVARVESRAPRRAEDPLVHRVVVVPRVWRATQDVRSRIVRMKSAADTARLVLTDVDPTLDPDKHLAVGDLETPVAEYRVQYEESSFAFVSRLLEDEGIGYRFTHGPDGDRLMLFEHNEVLPAAVRVPFVRGDRPQAPDATIHELRRRVATVPGSFELRDYDDQRPFPPPRVRAQAPLAGAQRRVGAHVTSLQPFTEEANGKRLAAVRLQEQSLRQRVYEGGSSHHALHAGDRVLVEDSPFGDGGDLELLVVEVRHTVLLDAVAETERGHRNEFVAIDASTPYRPARRTPKPRIHGLSHGVIVGPDLGAVAPVDELGRYLVRFFYAPEQTTPWIRRVQPLTGAHAGMHFPLQLGTEVAIAYVDGDPDRPMIVGAVPNLNTASPVTNTNASQNVIETASGARIEIDDNV